MSELAKVSQIRGLIIELRGKKIIIDRDLAMIYRVSTKRLNEQVRRNLERFPDDFMFQLTEEEKEQVVANCDHLKTLKFSPQLPYAFTRNGANMVSAILKSPIAIQRSVQIMRAFTALEELMPRKRKQLVGSPDIIKKISIHSKAIMRLFQETKANNQEVGQVKRIQKEMINLLQKMIAVSLGKE